jgi:hypothetical protein
VVVAMAFLGDFGGNQGMPIFNCYETIKVCRLYTIQKCESTLFYKKGLILITV